MWPRATCSRTARFEDGSASKRYRRGLLLAAAVLVGSIGFNDPWAMGQEAVPSNYGEVIEVNVVNVDVVVTDKRGNPVAGLTVDDFELSEDGRPEEISHFTFVSGKPTAVGAAGTESLPTAAAPLERLPMTERDSVWLVIYIDNLHIRLFERTRALDKLRKFVDQQLAPTDRVMLVTYDRVLRTRLAFTSDASRVAAALDDLAEVPARGDRYDSERRRLLQFIEVASGPKDAVEAIRPYAGQVRGDLWGALKGLEETVDLVAGLPGSKSILYVSGGLPLKPGAVLFQAVEYRWPGLLGIHELMLSDQTTEFDKLALSASESGVVLHTLDAAGVRAARSSGVEEELKTVVAISANMDGDERVNMQLPLRQLADSTGGRAILNRNDAGPALTQLADQLHTYYSLGYTPTRPADELFHRLKVKVLRDGVKLRHRSGYRDRAPALRMGDRLRAALAHGLEDNRLELGVEVDAASREASDRFAVPVRVTIPFRNLALLPEGGGYRCHFRLYLAAMDEDGGMSEVLEIPADLHFEEDEVESVRVAIWRMTQQLKMRGGDQRLAVGVRDELGLASSLTTRAIRVGVPAG